MGQLGTEYINPFLTALGDLANQNGALELSLMTTATAQRQFNTEVQLAGDTIYKSGFGEGFGDLLRDLIKGLRESQGGLEGLGKTFQAFFNTVIAIANTLIPILNSVFSGIGKVADAFNYAFGSEIGNKILGAVVSISLITKALRTAAVAATFLGIQIKIALAPILLAVAALDEIYSFFDDTRTNSLELLTGKEGIGAITTAMNPFSDFNTSQVKRMFTSQAPLPKPVIVNNNIQIDGVATAYENQMSITNAQAMVGGR